MMLDFQSSYLTLQQKPGLTSMTPILAFNLGNGGDITRSKGRSRRGTEKKYEYDCKYTLPERKRSKRHIEGGQEMSPVLANLKL